MTRFSLVVVTMLVALMVMSNAQAQETVPVTRDVEVNVFLIDIDEVNSVTESFVANYYAEMRWHDPSLAHAGPDSISVPLSSIWYPRVQILNEQRMVRTFPQSAEIRPDGEVIYRQRVWGSLSQPLVLKDFPFDSQKLEVILVGIQFGSTQVRFIPSPDSGVSDRLAIPDWKVNGWEFKAVDLPIGNKSTSVPGMIFSVDVERYISFFTLKVIFPLMLIVAMSWLVFWIDPSLAATQISVSVTAMLTLIAYRFAIGGMVPKLAFLTSLDYFVLGATILIFISLLEVVYTSYLSSHGKLEKARAVDAKARWIIPLVFVIVASETLVFRALI